MVPLGGVGHVELSEGFFGSPCYRGRNGSLPSIGWKGRFLRVENA